MTLERTYQNGEAQIQAHANTKNPWQQRDHLKTVAVLPKGLLDRRSCNFLRSPKRIQFTLTTCQVYHNHLTLNSTDQTVQGISFLPALGKHHLLVSVVLEKFDYPQI